MSNVTIVLEVNEAAALLRLLQNIRPINQTEQKTIDASVYRIQEGMYGDSPEKT